MPIRTIVVEDAVGILIEQWRIIEVRMGCNGQRENARFWGESNGFGIEPGRPNVGLHLGALQLARRRRLYRTCGTTDLHDERGKATVRGRVRSRDVEGSRRLRIGGCGDL